jgi:hypothetical protein
VEEVQYREGKEEGESIKKEMGTEFNGKSIH